MSHKKNKNVDRKEKEKVHTDDTLMDSLGRDNILSDGLLFNVDDTQRISNMLAQESLEKPIDFRK